MRTTATFQLLLDELCLEPKHAIAEPRERAITRGIRAGAASVIAAVNLDNELRGRRNEVSNEPAERYLPTKPSAECLASLVPTDAFRTPTPKK